MVKYVLRDEKTSDSYSLDNGWTSDYKPTFFNQMGDIKTIAYQNRFTRSWQSRELIVDTYSVTATVKLEDVQND